MKKQNKTPVKVGFVSLGCPKNQLDTEVMLRELYDAGFEIVSEDTEADIIVINTCAFIESAKQEAIDNIIDVGWLKKNHTLRGIVVTGCLAERYRDEIFTELPEVDAVLGVGSIHEIVNAVTEVANGKRFSSYEDKDTVRLGGDRILTTPDYTAYLKIAEGDTIRCECGFEATLDNKYKLHNAPFDRVNEWFEWQQNSINTDVDFISSKVRLGCCGDDGFMDEFAGEGEAYIDKDVFKLSGVMHGEKIEFSVSPEKIVAFPITPGKHFDVYHANKLIYIYPQPDERMTVKWVCYLDKLMEDKKKAKIEAAQA